MLELFAHFEKEGTSQYQSDKDLAKALEVVRETML
jgi:hypothetical protein